MCMEMMPSFTRGRLIGDDLRPEVFDDVAWSTEQVLAQTLKKIQYLGKMARLLPELADIDTNDDWTAFLQRLLDSQPPVS